MSILTKEVIQKILNDDWLLMDDCEGLENCTVIKELARMALAAMDSEPVAYMHDGEDGTEYNGNNEFSGGGKGIPLYAAPQLPQPEAVSEKIIDNFEEEFRRAFEVSAAVEQLIEIGYQGDKFSLSIRDAATFWKLGRAAMLQGGNSPVIPDGWTCNDKANAALMMLDRIETADPVDDDRIDGIKRIVRELAAAPHDTPALNSVQSVVTVPGKWIPVSERMPENDVSVLTFDGMYKRVHHAMYGHWQCWEPEKITHWMPLPAAPREVK